MRTKINIAYCSLVIWFALGTAQAQPWNWKYVEDIPVGARISVVSFQSLSPVECVFRGATPQTLLCDPRGHGGHVPRHTEFERRSVWQIRLQRRGNHSRHWGAIVGGSIGSIVGLASPDDKSAKDRLLLGMVLGGFGAAIGATADHDLPQVNVGPVIYEKPRE